MPITQHKSSNKLKLLMRTSHPKCSSWQHEALLVFLIFIQVDNSKTLLNYRLLTARLILIIKNYEIILWNLCLKSFWRFTNIEFSYIIRLYIIKISPRKAINSWLHTCKCFIVKYVRFNFSGFLKKCYRENIFISSVFKLRLKGETLLLSVMLLFS